GWPARAVTSASAVPKPPAPMIATSRLRIADCGLGIEELLSTISILSWRTAKACYGFNPEIRNPQSAIRNSARHAELVLFTGHQPPDVLSMLENNHGRDRA